MQSCANPCLFPVSVTSRKLRGIGKPDESQIRWNDVHNLVHWYQEDSERRVLELDGANDEAFPGTGLRSWLP
jgi:hypothetical protein